MGIRIPIGVKHDNDLIITSALVKSGYEAPTPQLLIPISIVKSLKLWLPEEANEVTLKSTNLPLRSF